MDEKFSVATRFCLKMFDRLQYETSYSCDINQECMNILAVKNDHKVLMLLRQVRKGMLKVTIEVERPIKKIADYEEKKRLEISLINSLEAYICASDEFVLGV